MISYICRKTAEALGRQLDANTDQVAVYAYGLEILLGSMIKLVLIILGAVLLGILPTTLIFTLTLVLFRWLGGGIHLKTYLRCLTVGLFMILGMSYVAVLEIDTAYVYTVFLSALFIALYVIVRWVPADTEKKRITNMEKRLKQKKESLWALGVWSLVVLAFLAHNFPAYALAASLGSLCSSFLMMPIGYRFIDSLDNILAVFSKGGEEVV